MNEKCLSLVSSNNIVKCKFGDNSVQLSPNWNSLNIIFKNFINGPISTMPPFCFIYFNNEIIKNLSNLL